MSVGKEYLKRIHEALAEFEEAVRRHEKPGMFEGKVPLQQTVDGAREKVVEVVVDIVTKDRLGR